MINALSVDGFKCLRGQRIALRQLTLLTGMNGVGKSTVIQSLLLLHQASAAADRQVLLNGPFGLSLGQALDVLPTGGMTAEVEAGDTAFRWSLEAEQDADLALRVLERPETAPKALVENFQYLHTDRVGPRESYELAQGLHRDARVGPRGQYVAQTLAELGHVIKVSPARMQPDRPDFAATLGKQIEAWMQDLVPSVEVRAQRLPGVNQATLQIKLAGTQTEWLRPSNAGFGITYALPIVVAALTAAPNSLLVVENPEAHLHPQGQSRLARLLATAAADGVQIVVETHSDHVLNGVRLAIVDKHPLRASDVVLQHFGPEPGVATEVELSVRGALSRALPGFFDQSERDLAAILKARRHAG